MRCSKSCVIIYVGMLLLTAGFVSSLGAWFAPPFNTFVKSVRFIGPILMLLGMGCLISACIICACEQGKCEACYKPSQHDKYTANMKRPEDISSAEHDLVRSFVSQESLNFDNVSPDCAECQQYIRSRGYEEEYLAYLERPRDSADERSTDDQDDQECSVTTELYRENVHGIVTRDSTHKMSNQLKYSEGKDDKQFSDENTAMDMLYPEETQIMKTYKDIDYPNSVSSAAVEGMVMQPKSETNTQSIQTDITCCPRRPQSFVNASDLKGVSPVMMRHMIRNNSSRFHFPKETVDHFLQEYLEAHNTDDMHTVEEVNQHDQMTESLSIPNSQRGNSNDKPGLHKSASQVYQRPKSLTLSRPRTSPNFQSDLPCDNVTVYIPLDTSDNFAPIYKAKAMETAASAFEQAQRLEEDFSDKRSYHTDHTGIVPKTDTRNEILHRSGMDSTNHKVHNSIHRLNSKAGTQLVPITISKRDSLMAGPRTGTRTVYDVSF